MDLSCKCVQKVFARKVTTYNRLACVMVGECVCKYYSDKLEAEAVWGSKCRERRRGQIICLLNNWLPTKPISDQIEFLNFLLNILLFTRDSSDNYKDYLQAVQLPQGHPLFTRLFWVISICKQEQSQARIKVRCPQFYKKLTKKTELGSK